MGVHHNGCSTVSIPFKREMAFQDFVFTTDGFGRWGFNSLQTGKGIPSECQHLTRLWQGSFQFPSNGKWHSKLAAFVEQKILKRVSIPFKREMAFQVNVLQITATHLIYGFNSLQTGNGIPSHLDDLLRQRAALVSIPFKREMAFQVHKYVKNVWV